MLVNRSNNQKVQPKNIHNHPTGRTGIRTKKNTNRRANATRNHRRKKVVFFGSCTLIAFFLFSLNLWGRQRIVQQSEEVLRQSFVGTGISPLTNTTYIYPTRSQPISSSIGGGNSGHACDGYRGIYHIEKGDIGGAAGTIFFQFVIGQILWAEKHNFKPWVHLNNVSYVIYDNNFHGRGPGKTFTMMDGVKISYVERPNGHRRDAYPGEPYDFDKARPKVFHFEGSGVWEDYFEPVSDFQPGDTSCREKPLVTMDLYQITPGVHGFAPWAPRCWRYTYLPDYITKPHIPLHEWLEPQRHLAHDALKRYIRFKPFIRERAEQINPNCSLKNSCLAIHIRHSDKAAGRRVISTDEFLPFVEAFVASGGSWIYLATDSGSVIKHVETKWPEHIRKRIRSIGDGIIRSNNREAVFDIASHHQTNTEILIEILALSKCQFIVHGLSAVTETSIWINVDLHFTAVNLEDPEHLNSNEFASLVSQVLSGGDARKIYKEERPTDWWDGDLTPKLSSPTQKACEDVEGVLLISHVGADAAAGYAFFGSVLNQLYYAEKYNLKPWVYLDGDSEHILDVDAHGQGPGVMVTDMTRDLEVSVEGINKKSLDFAFPGPPMRRSNTTKVPIKVAGDGIWSHYFHPVSDFVPGDRSCSGKPMIVLDSHLVMPGISLYAPWAVRPWRSDGVPDEIWKPDNMTLKSWLHPQRRKASELVKKYYKFHPRLLNRAKLVNPVNESSSPCMAIHLRNSDKKGTRYRSKFPVNKFRDFINAFIRAGGTSIYVATDSNSVLDHINLRYPLQIRKAIRTQGTYVVRSSSKWSIQMLEKHHRTNSEALVDILAMSKCKLLLHGHSTMSEAAIYLNEELHENSVNWEDPDHMSAERFEKLARVVLGTVDDAPVALLSDMDPSEQVTNATIVKVDSNRICRRNAIVYLAQKKHTSYDRDSYGLLLRSMELLFKNYLSIEKHIDNVDIIVFHTAEFDENDLDTFGDLFGSEFRNAINLVDLNGTQYWKRPKWHIRDNPLEWHAYPLFSEGYRRMMHWFAIDMWNYFEDFSKSTGCNYEYVMRFDEDSFLHSAVYYDIFDFMKRNDYWYGFRLCAYEMQVTQRIWKMWRTSKGSPSPFRDIDLEMCGIYNNFFVARTAFFQKPAVQKFLNFIDRQGMIYRRRLGDLMIHSMAVYGFAQPEKIHRFLDFTYEHATIDKDTECVVWGGIQAGYNDPHSEKNINDFIENKVVAKGCRANITTMYHQDLSPSYSHMSMDLISKTALKTVMAGKVEFPGMGILSG